MPAMNSPHHRDPSNEAPTLRGRTGSVRIGVGLFGAPLAWIAQVFLCEPLAARACYPYLAPLSGPILEGLPLTLAAISLACLATALLSGFIVWGLWRQFEYRPVQNGKEGERQRFLVHLGAMSSFIFIVAIIFNLCAIWQVSPCSSWL